MKTRPLYRQSGLNLIEILIAALILSVGLLSMAGLQVASLKSAQNATQKQQAAAMVHELLERMRSNRTAVLAGHYLANVSCASSTPPLDCTGAVACSPVQLATFDLHNIQCGSHSGATVGSGVANQLLAGKLSVSCQSGCSTGAITIKMTWHERLGSDDVQQSIDGTVTNAETQAFNITVDALI